MLIKIASYVAGGVFIVSAVIFGMFQVLRVIDLTRAALARELLSGRGRSGSPSASG